MKITVRKGKIEALRTDAAVVPVFDGEGPGPGAAHIDKVLKGAISRLLRRGDFMPKAGNTAVLYPDPEGPMRAERVVLAGLGRVAELTADRVRLAAGRAATAARNAGARDLLLSVTGIGLLPEQIGQAIAEGVMLGLYRFLPYKTGDDENGRKNILSCTLVAEESSMATRLRKGAEIGRTIAEASSMARDMVNTPSADMTPEAVARVARRLARTHRLKVRVLGRADMRKLGMGALLGVSSGSVRPPVFVIAEHRAGGRKPWIVLVGKTITFDSGGISIKPSENMDRMKDDMAGGAAVLAAVRAAAELRIPLNVAALLPATENMPSGSAYKPGDVLRTLSGKTIEIMNTDAEGRLVLADALSYASRYKPAAIIDIATLTGACRIALGQEASGMLGNDEKLKERVRAAGETTGERVWELPLWDGYCEQIKSDIADMKNTGGRDGGVITAACLLSKFVERCPWVHLDIAATAWTEKDRPYTPKGATGVGARLLTQVLRDFAEGGMTDL